MKRLQQILFFILAIACATAPQAQAGIKVTYFHNDATGTPVAASDEAGEVIWRKAFRPFGSELDDGGAIARDNTIGYTGHRFDSDLDLVYAGARYYDPMIGRFLSMDPVGFQEGNVHSFNKYTYVANNPYKYIDPNGEELITATIVVLSVAAGVFTVGNNAINAYEQNTSVFDTGISPDGAKAAAKSLAVDGAIAVGTAGILGGLGIVGKQILGKVAKGPTIGGGGTLEKLTPSEIRRIQNAANRSGKDIGVVGSRVNPNKTVRPDSDYDFVIDANNKTRGNLSRSLPGGKSVREGLENNQDIYKGTVDTNRPHVIFHPE